MIAVRPQPLGIFALPAGYLILPPSDARTAAPALAALLRGARPDEWPPEWNFYAHALDGDIQAALAALPASSDPLTRYNRYVLDGAPADDLILSTLLTGELASLQGVAAFTMGHRSEPPPPTGTTGEVRALVLITHAAAAIECNDILAADQAFADALAAAVNVSPVLAGYIALNRAELAIQHGGELSLITRWLQQALNLIPAESGAEQRARAALQLGQLLHEHANGQRGPLQAAVRCYQEALRFYQRETYPLEFAFIQNNLALAYLAMPMTEASDRLRGAIAVQALRAALSIYDPDRHPREWAGARLNLANALQYVHSAHPAEHLLEAVAIYEDLLQRRDSATDPAGYARILANLGNALAHLGIFAEARERLRQAEHLFTQIGDESAMMTVRELLANIDQYEAVQH
ncbi:tetratricopeptide repeat protein [Chloroflexus aggregans]|uniref:Tetratricopeptide TPR_4 n=1 Tax=Chloroflexus aggregans (strain MD-66 / DSM 9485) TaxID=326427 RepID=B8G3N2_CHLAD|nr:hypothetical protein [Chloroflexus aggregans]ACL23415.1 tetratricopeptide TPR_4 [Chloroflexus aggregans DSM 9485]